MSLPSRLSRRAAFLVAATGFLPLAAFAQTTINASSLALRSSGVTNGGDVTLSTNGYLGTYVTLAAPGSVSFNLNASGVADAGVAPRLSLIVADNKTSFDVGNGFNAYQQSIDLPAGTHFVRLQYDNDNPAAASRALTLRNLQVTGATVSNTGSNANALAAANTYIANYRKGEVRIALRGPGNIPLLPGTPVNAKMSRNQFNFGGTVSGLTNNDSKDMLQSNPAVGSEAYKFQQFINRNFNTIVPSNGGKWEYNEPSPNNVNMTLVDKQLAYAQSHNMKARMHTVIWGNGATSGNQQPTWVNNLISGAAGGNATSKANLCTSIANRLNYYAGTTGNRSQKYIELDVLNESLHNPSYYNIYGDAGIANIYNQAAAAVAAAGSTAKIYINEWNVIQYSPNTISGTGAGSGSDPYANWYRQHAENLINAGAALSGIGVQYYANVTQGGSNIHSAATIEKALQNLSVTGLPISMTEFGLAAGTTKTNSQNLGPAVLEDTMRMFYGNPNATTFMMWGWWDTSGAAYPPAALLDNSQGNNVLSSMGTKWEQLMAEWSTNVTPSIDANGLLAFNGFYGDYNIGAQAGFSNLTLSKGTSDYALSLAAPPTWSFWKPANSGAWSAAGSWTGGIANGVGMTAHFGSAAAARLVSLDAPLSVGQINFDSTNPYTINGASTLTLDGLANAAALNVVAGSHQIDAPLQLADHTTAWIAPAGSTLNITNLLNSPGVRLDKTGEGTLIVNRVDVGALTIHSGKITLAATDKASHAAALNIAPGATLDLADSLAIDGDVQSTVVLHLLTGRLVSGAVLNNSNLAIGIAGSAELGVTVFDGYTLAAPATLVRVTLKGDHDLDGAVDFDDLLTLAQNYGDLSTGKRWIDGDSNYDGTVNFDDLLALAQNYNVAASVDHPTLTTWLGNTFAVDWSLARSLVPDPSSIPIVCAPLWACLRSRSRLG
jgi:GH35 family endo-1,4-beta-xylanase